MKESYRKGVANHPGPEPCEGSRGCTRSVGQGYTQAGYGAPKTEMRGADGVSLTGRQ
jgi:hypothetical protein